MSTTVRGQPPLPYAPPPAPGRSGLSIALVILATVIAMLLLALLVSIWLVPSRTATSTTTVATTSAATTTIHQGTTAPHTTSATSAPKATSAGDSQAAAEAAVKAAYLQKVASCAATQGMKGHVKRIDWDDGFHAGLGGKGVVVDSDPALGGPFTAAFKNGHWNVAFEFC